MLARHGHLGWWPGDTPFETCVGAILTQNTSWRNVERAIANLKQAGVLEPRPLFALASARLARLLRPAGYFNVKARRLRAFLKALVEDFGGDLAAMLSGDTATVRERLLAISGIGPETADSILLYAGGHLSFVIDAYTRRIFKRHEWYRTKATPKRAGNPSAVYHELQSLCETALNVRSPAELLDYWQDYHAQLVMVGKDYCRPREPRCDTCPLGPLLPKAPTNARSTQHPVRSR